MGAVVGKENGSKCHEDGFGRCSLWESKYGCHFTVNDKRQWSYFTADCEIIQDQSVVMEKQPAFHGLHLNHKSRVGYCASLAALRVGSARRSTTPNKTIARDVLQRSIETLMMIDEIRTWKLTASCMRGWGGGEKI